MTAIIAGRARGRRLEVPAGRQTRPTLGRVREALFSMLASRLDFDGLHVLDLFAGSGALGLEAWSRGAAHVTFVEHDPRTARLIARNASTLAVPAAQYALVTGRLPRALDQVAPGAPFDLVFLDPPYAEQALYDTTLHALARSGHMAVDALVCVEHDARRDFAAPHAAFVHLTTRARAATAITLLAWAPDDAPSAPEPDPDSTP